MPILVARTKTKRDSPVTMRVAMPQIIHHRREADNEPFDDMLPEALMLAGVSIAATYLSAGGDPWSMCIPGAIFSSFVALLKTTQDKRSWPEKTANSVGISFIGSTAPAGIIQYFWPHFTEKLTWQLAALLGFGFGLCGWPLAYAFVKVFGLRSERFANRKADQWERQYGGDDQSSDHHEDERK